MSKFEPFSTCITLLWWYSWNFRKYGPPKYFSQNWHLNDFSSVWHLSWWFFKLETVLNPFSHNLHSITFTPVCVFSCAFNSLDCINLFPQYLHSNFFSPVWIFSCLCKFSITLKHFPQVLQSNDFSLVWTISCLLNLDASRKVFWHILHLNCFSDEWIFWWWFKQLLVLLD